MAAPTGGAGIAPPKATINPGGVRKGAPATGGKAIGKAPVAPRTPKPAAPKVVAPKLPPRPGDPSIGGHYVKLGNKWQLIHAVGPGKWAKGPVPTAGPGVPANSPLLNPNATLSGQAAYNAAKAAADAQTVGPMAELTKQIAANNRQTAGTINAAGGYFNQLGQQAQQGQSAEDATAATLRDQLAGIGQQSQQALAGIGQNATDTLLKYAPQGEGSLAAPAISSLASEIARQQGLAAQQNFAGQAVGAVQSGNYGNLMASNRATQALAGTSALRGIAQSGTVTNQPLTQKIADLQAQHGSLLASNLAKFRQQEINNQITSKGLGIKQDTITAENQRAANTITAANQRSQNTISAENQRSQNTISAENQRQQNALAVAEKKAAANSRKPLTTGQNNSMLTMLGKAASIYGEGRQAKLSPQAILQSLTSGRSPSGKTMAPINPVIAQAAMELWTYHFLNPRTAAALHNMGVRGGTFQGAPIQVGGPPAGVGSVGNAVGKGVGAVGKGVGKYLTKGQ